jgi:hypothetical protein
MAYTPSTTFVFSGGSYTPSTTVVFSTGSAPDVITGAFSATLDNVTGAFSATLAPQGVLNATLEDVTGTFTAVVAMQGALTATLEDVVGHFVGYNVANIGHFSATLEGVAAVVTGHYNPNVHRFTVSALCANQGNAGSLTMDTPLAQHQAVYLPTAICVARQDTAPANRNIMAVQANTLPISLHAVSSVDAGEPMGTSACADLRQMTPVPISRCGTVDEATRLDSGLFSVLYQLERIFTESHHPIDDTGATVHTLLRRVFGEPPEAYRYTPGTTFVFTPNDEYNPSSSFTWPYSVPPTDLIVNSQKGGIRHGVDSHWQRATRHQLHQCSTVQDARRPSPGTSIWIDPPRPPPVTPPDHTIIHIPDQTSYLMQHSLSVTLLDLTPVPMASVRLNYDADSFAWQFGGQLADKAALPLVKQATGQPPVQLIVTINGYSWKVLVERIGRSHEFAKNSITLTGRGLTALLGQPYEQPASATQGSALTVQQLAELLLPPGWTINWTAPTWLVPAGAYSYSNQTPIQALAAIAKDIGAMLVPARDNQTIHIMPRYPVLPWYFAAAEPDVIIPEAPVIGATETTVALTQANAVYVHGAEIGGVLAWCRLNGTAGDRLAPSVSNALMTDVIGCRALGERILAGQYEQPGIQSITLPMDGASIPLLSVGQLTDITVDGVSVRGIVNGAAIDATLASVRQTIQIGEETPNQWTQFKDLLPRDPLLVATLVETDGTTSLTTLLDGGVVRVRGTGTVGGKYYIRAGKIDGEAPNMVQNEVVV